MYQADYCLKHFKLFFYTFPKNEQGIEYERFTATGSIGLQEIEITPHTDLFKDQLFCQLHPPVEHFFCLKML